jgi:YVTN family beta-propeller protein
MDIQSKELDGAFQLYPMIIPGSRDSVLPAGIAHVGIPQSIYQEPKGLLMVIDPQTTLSQAMAAYDSVVVWLNDEETSVGTIIQPGAEGDRIALYLPPGFLLNGVNHLFYRWTRSSGNFEDSKPILDVLYHDPAPGYPAPAGIVVTHPASVGPTEAAQGVVIYFNVSYARPFDTVALTVGTERRTIIVTDPAQPITLTLTAADFKQIGDNPQTPISARVVDQLGNSNLSATTFMDIHASESRYVVAFLNGPYSVAPGGRVKDIELSLTREGQGTAGTLSVILPAGTVYPDGTGGARDFRTRADGTLTVEGIKGAITPGTYTLTASSDGSTATETLRVTAYGQSGVIAVGPNVRDITCSADGARVYVAPVNNNSIAVIDTEKTTVERYIPVQANGWNHHVLSRDGKRAFAGNIPEQRLYVLDIERSAIIASFPVGQAPFNVALNQDETLAFVSNLHGASVDVIDLQTLQVIKRIPVGQSPYQCVAHPDGKFMYLSAAGSNSIQVIDIQTLLVVRSIGLKSSPLNLAITPDGNSIFVNVNTSVSTDDILQVNAYTGAVIRTLPFSDMARAVVVNHAGTQAFCCNLHTDTVSIIDIASGAVRRVRVGRLPVSIAVSPDDSLGYVSCSLDGTVHIISLQSTGLMGVSGEQEAEIFEPKPWTPTEGDDPFLGANTFWR